MWPFVKSALPASIDHALTGSARGVHDVYGGKHDSKRSKWTRNNTIAFTHIYCSYCLNKLLMLKLLVILIRMALAFDKCLWSTNLKYCLVVEESRVNVHEISRLILE
jgi:hypothetical protein